MEFHGVLWCIDKSPCQFLNDRGKDELISIPARLHDRYSYVSFQFFSILHSLASTLYNNPTVKVTPFEEHMALEAVFSL